MTVSITNADVDALQGAVLDAPLHPMDVAGRLGRLRERFPTAAADGGPIDALVVTNLTNVRYLTGFTGSAAMLVVTSADPTGTAPAAVLITDGRYRDQASAQVEASGASVRVHIVADKQLSAVRDVLVAAGASRVGLEADAVSWSTQRSIVEIFAETGHAPEGSGLDAVATTGVVEELRITKDLGELDRMLRAAAIADQALANVIGLLAGTAQNGTAQNGTAQAQAQVQGSVAGELTEAAFGLALDTEIRRLGASANSFETIVASGPNGALPHARPTDRVIRRGDLLVLDFGAVVDGYCSDMTRTLGIGAPGDLSDRLVAMWNAVLESQAAGVAAVGPGVESKTVDAACREVLERHELLEYFTHSTGHGVGLDIHEAPRVSKPSTATLAPGFVVTVEPGVYLSPHGGVRIEDTVVVTEDGCRPLTSSPKTLFVV